MSRFFCAAAALIALLVEQTAATTYVAPGPTETMSAANQIYQLGVWSFILFAVIGFVAFYAVASMDYSNESLLMVDVESKDQH